MSAQDTGAPPNRYTRTRLRRKPMLDLNAACPDSNLGQEGASTDDGIHVEVTRNEVGGVPVPPTPIDLEEVDDDVIILSARAFAEAKNSRTNRGRPIVVDIESGDLAKTYKRRRTGPTLTLKNPDQFINLEGTSSLKSIAPPTPPPPKEPSFSCPVCMGPLVEETSTKCGHIFCKGCIKAATTAQNKCPTCRRKVLMKDLIRVYLPATS
ncbi:hypothetical protein Leryth_003312 [Lithospermum erythrorhizon]|uniref:RING-type domain-containing protein n=1 Tax=Lithospermum erythrorhizon TaxID=34254 RepID=A0AAV3P2L9_LITER|nr:hypothetical protein Leryth_003312 [Lithospermum erythrorhizon]